MIKIDIIKKILKYAIPNVISMWIFTLYTMVDGIFISRYVGDLGLAGVNISFPLINLIFSISVMIGIGSSTLISINFGKNKIELGNKLMTLSTFIILFIGIFITLFVSNNLDLIIKLLGANKVDPVYIYVKDYLSIVILFSTFYMLGYAFEIYIKVDKNPIFPLKCVLAGAITNIILDYILIVIFPFGVKGAAIATGCSQVMSCSILFLYVKFKGTYIKFIKITKDTLLNIASIFKIGTSEFITEISTGLLILIYNLVILNKLGIHKVSIFGVINYITSLIVMTMIGFSQGIQPLISYYFGKKEYKLLKSILKISLLFLFILGIFCYFIVNLFSIEIGKIFFKEQNYVMDTKNILNIYSLSYLLLGINILISAYFTAIKKIFYSILITIPRGVLLNTIFLLVLPQKLGENGIWMSAFLSEIITLFIAFSLLKKLRFANK